MSKLRAVLRAISLGVFLLVMYLLWAIVNVFLFHSDGARLRWRAAMVSLWGKGASRIIGMSIEIRGRAPDPPFCMVANHLSYLDIVLMQATTKSTLVSKSEIGNWPVLGFLGRQLGTLFIDRKLKRDVVRINDLIAKVLHRGDGLVFFPEGTSTGGSEVGPFSSSLLNYPAKSSYPVHFASLSYHSRFVEPSQHICWWADMTFGDHFWYLLQAPSFTASIAFGEAPVTDTDRKVLTRTLRENVVKSFVPSGKIST